MKISIKRKSGKKKVTVSSFTQDGKRGSNTVKFKNKKIKSAARAGSYTVTLTVTDAAGNKSKKTAVVRVKRLS